MENENVTQMKCADPAKWQINCLDPVVLGPTRHCDAKLKINLASPYCRFLTLLPTLGTTYS